MLSLLAGGLLAGKKFQPTVNVLSPEGVGETRRCETSEICVGLGCRVGGEVIMDGKNRLADSSIWVSGEQRAGFEPSGCTTCSCKAPQWPHPTCNVTLIPARSEKESSLESLGYGSRTNDILLGAAYALEHGNGLAHPVQSCPDEMREENAFCFFQPVSKCGSEAYNLWLWGGTGVSLYEDKSDMTFYDMNYATICDVLGNPNGDCHTNRISMWRRIAQHVLQVQPEIEVAVHEAWLANLSWYNSGTPYLAMHVRRTDKVKGESGGKPEAVAIGACDYAEGVQLAAAKVDQLDIKGLTVFVATDDPAVLEELANCSTVYENEWKLESFAQYAAPGRGMSLGVMYRLWAEIRLLLDAAAVSGTFSSNMGRLTQLLRTKPQESFVSVDLASFTSPFDIFPLEEITMQVKAFKNLLMAGKGASSSARDAEVRAMRELKVKAAAAELVKLDGEVVKVAEPQPKLEEAKEPRAEEPKPADVDYKPAEGEPPKTASEADAGAATDAEGAATSSVMATRSLLAARGLYGYVGDAATQQQQEAISAALASNQ